VAAAVVAGDMAAAAAGAAAAAALTAGKRFDANQRPFTEKRSWQRNERSQGAFRLFGTKAAVKSSFGGQEKSRQLRKKSLLPARPVSLEIAFNSKARGGNTPAPIAGSSSLKIPGQIFLDLKNAFSAGVSTSISKRRSTSLSWGAPQSVTSAKQDTRES
jgi:hypothetical protein